MNATPLLSALSLIQRSPFCFQLCSSRKKVIFPQKALNSQNKWMWDMFVMIYWWCSRWSTFQLGLIGFIKWIYSYGSFRFVVNVDNFTQSVEVDECQVWPSSAILCHHLLMIINITNATKSVDSTSVRWNLHHPYDRALALEEGKVKTLDLVSTAEARATILEARLAGQKCNKVQKCIQNSTHSLIVIAHHPFLPIIISFFMRTKSNDQVHVKTRPSKMEVYHRQPFNGDLTIRFQYSWTKIKYS